MGTSMCRLMHVRSEETWMVVVQLLKSCSDKGILETRRVLTAAFTSVSSLCIKSQKLGL